MKLYPYMSYADYFTEDAGMKRSPVLSEDRLARQDAFLRDLIMNRILNQGETSDDTGWVIQDEEEAIDESINHIGLEDSQFESESSTEVVNEGPDHEKSTYGIMSLSAIALVVAAVALGLLLLVNRVVKRRCS